MSNEIEKPARFVQVIGTGLRVSKHKSDRVSFQDVIGKQNVGTVRMNKNISSALPRHPVQTSIIVLCALNCNRLPARPSPGGREAPAEPRPFTQSLLHGFIQQTFTEHTLCVTDDHDPRAWPWGQ